MFPKLLSTPVDLGGRSVPKIAPTFSIETGERGKLKKVLNYLWSMLTQKSIQIKLIGKTKASSSKDKQQKVV